MKDTLILAIESSCDETAASVVKNGRTILSNVISSQIALHTLYGGVVPEIASRKHIEKINQVIEQALADADVTLDDLDAIGVTYGPGLVGALLVGVAEAKAIAYAKKLPLVGVHHIEGHVSANYIEHPDLEPPFLCLIVSGGHTHLVIVKDYGEFEILGRTRDDAAGEAFDKVARAIGLGYPGGPKVDKLSKEGNPNAIEFPKAKIGDCPYDFSFSGVKSAVLNYINHAQMTGEEINRADLAASFQKAVVDVLVEHTMLAAKDYGMTKIAIAGGVIECRITGTPAGLGEPVFDKLSALLAHALMSIGAVKAVEIGDGIAVTSSNGSTDNDGFTVKDGEIIKTSNHAGGIMGGISDGSEIILRAHIKPTPSISQPQQTVTKDKEPLSLEIHGRHDPVIVPRAVVVVESMAAITLADALFVNMSSQMDKVRDFYRK